MKKIFLYGPPGSGKSTAGKALAANLDTAFLDLDPMIETKAGSTIPEIMAGQGEAAFRELEAAALDEALAGPAGVIALGGGALLREVNRSKVEAAGTVVCLQAGLETLLARLRADAVQRPLLAGDLEAKLSALLEKRSDLYRSFSVRIQTDGLTPDRVAWQIQLELGRFRVHGMGPAYDVIVSSAGLDCLGELLREGGLAGPVALVTDANVGPLYADRVAAALRGSGYECRMLTNPAGEEAKTLETVAGLWRGCLQAGLDRRSTVVALGGGVTGDLAGFAASTFLRGVAWVGVPTTLLAMADASIGGKTGFDLPEGKNLIGSFYPPRLVLADPDLLASLPERELRSGLAEVVKNGIVGDPVLFEQCAAGLDAVRADLAGIVRHGMGVKVAVVEADPFEGGQRAALNLGHTVGHAVETASGYRLRHGEAVSIGMVAEARLSERLGMASPGLSEEIGVALTELGLPTAIPDELTPEAIIRGMRVDKKKAGGVVRFALPIKIGQVEVGVAVEDLDLLFDGSGK